MKNVKMFVIGFIFGVTLLFSTSSFAQTMYEQVQVSLRSDINLVVNDEEIKLQKNPLSYQGSTYVHIRELEQVFNKEIEWDGKTSTISVNDKIDKGDEEVVTQPAQDEITVSTYQGMRAIEYNGETYFNGVEYDRKVRNSNSEVKVYWKNWEQHDYSILIIELGNKQYEIQAENPSDMILYDGESYVNSKYYIVLN